MPLVRPLGRAAGDLVELDMESPDRRYIALQRGCCCYDAGLLPGWPFVGVRELCVDIPAAAADIAGDELWSDGRRELVLAIAPVAVADHDKQLFDPIHLYVAAKCCVWLIDP